jgi:predicted PurR-regulated permease PerM
MTDRVPVNPVHIEDAMPLPTDPKVIFLGGLFFLGLAAALYVAAEIVWPLIFAFMLSLLFKPVQRNWRGFTFPSSFLRS